MRPFLKWAGGKRQLLPRLRAFYPERFGTYFEPFVGSGAVFFDLYNRGELAGHRAVLMDSNADLVGCFLMVRRRLSAVIRHLKALAREREHDPRTHYYAVRDGRFNPIRRHLANRGRDLSEVYTPALAALFIYLNRTGFNGLFRLNASGGFNVPMGRYENPRICDAENLAAVARALASDGTCIARAHFSTVLAEARPGDFLYFDPPYAPLSPTATFTSYTAGGFPDDAQRHLQQVVVELATRGCHVVLSNSTASLIEALYEEDEAARRAGLRTYRIPARRAINSNGSRRGPVFEYIVTNVESRGSVRLA